MTNGHKIMTDNKYVAAADFKANCLRLMDEVAQQRRPIIITKRGKPVAKLVPIEEQEAIDLFGRMAGKPRYVATSSAQSRTRDGLAMPRTSEPGLAVTGHPCVALVRAGRRRVCNGGAPGDRRGRRRGYQLRVAAISLWEVALLASRGRVVLGRPPALWLRKRWPSRGCDRAAQSANRGRKLRSARGISSRPG